MSYSSGLSADYREYVSASFQSLIDDKLLIASSDNSDIAMIKVASIGGPIDQPSVSTPTPGPTTLGNSTGAEPPVLSLNLLDVFTFNSTGKANQKLRGVLKVNIKAYKDVLIGNDALLSGYPSSLTSSAQLDPLQPLLRRGLIAGVNEQNKTIIVDAPSYRGNSGGPVFEMEQVDLFINFKVIGVVSQFVALTEGGEDVGIRFNTGYSVITPLDGILAFI
jgi:hypothetical protein